MDGVLGRGTGREGWAGGRGGDRVLDGGYCIVCNTLMTEPSAPLAYDPGSEHQHPNMSILGGHGGWLEKDICPSNI